MSNSRLLRSILFFAVAGVALYGGATLVSDYRIVVQSLLDFPVKSLLIVIVLVVLGWLIRGWRFHYYLLESGEKIRLSYSISAFLAGFALTGTPGKVGEAVKGVFLKDDYGVPVTKTFGILVIERLMDLCGVLFLGSLSLLLFTEWKGLFFLCAAAVLGGGFFLSVEGLYRPVLETLGRVSFLSWICSKVLSTLFTCRSLMNPKVFIVGLIVSVLAWGMESASMYIVLRGFGIDASVLDANFVYCLSTLVGALSMLPGGIGGTEASMLGILGFMGVSYARGLPAVILIRVCTLWMAVLIGLVFIVYMMWRGKIPSEAKFDAGAIDTSPGETGPG